MKPLDWTVMLSTRALPRELYELEALAHTYACPTRRRASAELATLGQELEEGSFTLLRYRCLDRILALIEELRQAYPEASRFLNRFLDPFSRVVFCLATADRLAMGWPTRLQLEEAAALLEAEMQTLGGAVNADEWLRFAEVAHQLPRLAVRLQDAWQRATT